MYECCSFDSLLINLSVYDIYLFPFSRCPYGMVECPVYVNAQFLSRDNKHRSLRHPENMTPRTLTHKIDSIFFPIT